ncbi:hypothetical protein [Dysgonomonas capnocytophagoides]|uniref:hypothetical protein n=1 Tax=Dysgonomonas capnocytophagoides TaxID=45254 RepID=UPI003340A912
MKKPFLLLFLSIFMFSACSSDDDSNENNKIKLTASFQYLSNGEKKPDAATVLYIFKIDKTEQRNYEFKTGQKYLEHKENKTVVYPLLTPKANNEGLISIDLEDNIFYQTVFISAIQPETWGIEYLDAKGKALSISKEYALK